VSPAALGRAGFASGGACNTRSRPFFKRFRRHFSFPFAPASSSKFASLCACLIPPATVAPRSCRACRQTAAASDAPRLAAASSRGMFNQSSAGLHQALLHAGERPVADRLGQCEPPPEVAQVVGEHAQPQAHLIGAEAVAGKPCHRHRLFALLERQSLPPIRETSSRDRAIARRTGIPLAREVQIGALYRDFRGSFDSGVTCLKSAGPTGLGFVAPGLHQPRFVLRR